MLKNIQYLLALHSVNGLGPVRLRALLDYFQDPKLAWEVGIADLQEIGIPRNAVDALIETRKTLVPQKYLESIEKSKIKWITIFDEAYPKLLKQIYDPPVVLYYMGEIESWNAKAIAVVGTRKITGYGRSVTEQFVTDLVGSGLVIVSGLAKGVDTMAHKAAIKAGGQTWVILGGGLNNIYPAENIGLAKQIIEGFGVVISEHPPDYQSLPGNFPARNRIISGLSLAVLVTEAAIDSGSLITAKEAVEQGRDVFAIPGAITSEMSKGPVSLIREGAKPVFSADEILEELGLVGGIVNPERDLNLSQEERKVLDCLDNEEMHIDEICRELGLPIHQVSALVLKMEIVGLVRGLGGGIYSKG